MSSIISEQNLNRIEDTKKYVLKTAIWLLVGSVILGASVILMGGFTKMDVIGKFIGTLFVVSLMMIISVNNFKMIATKDSTVQIFALVGLFSNIAWALLWAVLIWVPELGSTCSYYRTSGCGSTLLFKFACAFSYLSALGLIGSNVLSIAEYDKKGLIRPLKITGVICATYEMLYFTIMTFLEFKTPSVVLERFGALALFVGFAWIAIVCAASIISKNAENSKQKGVSDDGRQKGVASVPKTDEELRAEIEEKVRREMIEKEVREKLEKEKE